MAYVDILVVEDNPADVFLISLFLRESAIAMNIHVAYDGCQAEHMLFEESMKADLVLLDINLPNKNGLDVLRRIRQDHSSMPVVIFTSSTSPKDRETARIHGASDFVTKPRDLDGFHQAIGNIVNIWIHPLTHEARQIVA